MAVLLQDVISPAVWLLMTVSFLYFLWGIVSYIWKGNSSTAREDGARHMLWGIVGIAIMISVFGIMHFIFGTITTVGGCQGIHGTVSEPTVDKGFGGFSDPGSSPSGC